MEPSPSSLWARDTMVDAALRWVCATTTPYVPAPTLESATTRFGAAIDHSEVLLALPATVLAALVGSLPPDDPWRGLSGTLVLGSQGRLADPSAVVARRRGLGAPPPTNTGAVLPDGSHFGGPGSCRDLLFGETTSTLGADLPSPASALIAFAIDGPEVAHHALVDYYASLVAAAWRRSRSQPSSGPARDSTGTRESVRTPLLGATETRRGQAILGSVIAPAVRWLLWRRSAYGICGCGGSGGMPLAVAMGECLRAAMTYRESRDPADLVIDLRDFAIPAGEYRFLTTGERNW